MKLGRREFNFVAAALVGLVIAAPAMADVLDTIMSTKKIRVATDMGIPPYGMLDGSMQPTGSDVAVAKLLAADWGVELEFVNTTGPTRIPNINTDKADVVISSLSVTEERKKAVDFTRPYSFIRTTVIAPTEDTAKEWTDLSGKAIAVVRSTTQDIALTEMAPEFGFNVVRYDDDATAITAAISGQAIYLGLADPQMRAINERSTAKQFEAKIVINQFPIAMAVKQGETRLAEKLNEWIAENAANGKLNEAYKAYHDLDIPAEILN
ncbi:transporter substrate-binding domain-containing protein [Shinella daejeonensis]|uniref:transporter substrate-binding domain-containing protein n=1 Tax=Shinella daejeonensis TaxID=659017 RepID=UPI0020C7C839|nr:transporter substrate-binding domain-containing protein [Shinella daejeonensis]MCP8895080.1 transporter substrate-binding domain-containing protein [Shinella daejeonensis]